MHKSNEDCFYFLTSSCAKGSSCTYRHSPLALTCNLICPSWLRGNCLDPACPYRHSAVQRPMTSNGISCFYENTPMGCLKPDCTFMHSHPRMNLRNPPTIRPLSTNLIKKDETKPIVTNTPPTAIPQITPVSGSSINSSQSTINVKQSVIPNTILESSSKSETPSPIVKSETIARRIAVSSDTEQTNETKNLSDNNNNNLSLIKSTTRSVITDSPKGNQEETTTTQSRLIVNRNVVIAESTSSPNRKIVQTTLSSSSNRVVVSSSKEKKGDLDLVEQENNSKKFKHDSSSTVAISLPGSTPLIINRSAFMPPSKTTSTNDTKRIRLSATKASSGNSSTSVSKPSNEEKTSAGTELSQADERRTMRIERFQKKTISPPRSIVSSSVTTTNTKTLNSSVSRNVITSSPNARKRTAPETTIKDAPPSKRVSASPSQDQSSSRQTTSSRNVSTDSHSSSIRDKNWEKQTNEFIAKTGQRKNSSSTTTTTTVQSESVFSSVVRPRFTPQPIVPPPLQQPSTKTPRLRQPPSVVIKRPVVSVAVPSQTSTKPIEQIPSNTTENNVSPLKPTVEHQTFNIFNEEDENILLKLNEPSDVVDTFALIDEALLEADHLLELM